MAGLTWRWSAGVMDLYTVKKSLSLLFYGFSGASLICALNGQIN